MADSPNPSHASEDSLSPLPSTHVDLDHSQSQDTPGRSPRSMKKLGTADDGTEVASEADLEVSNGYKLRILAVSCDEAASNSSRRISIHASSSSSESSSSSSSSTSSSSRRRRIDVEVNRGITAINGHILLPWDEAQDARSDILRFTVQVVCVTAAASTNGGISAVHDKVDAPEVVTEVNALKSMSEVAVTMERFAAGKQVAMVLPAKALESKVDLLALVERATPYQTHPLFQDDEDVGSQSLLEVQLSPVTKALSYKTPVWVYISPEDDLPYIQDEYDDLCPLTATSKGVVATIDSDIPSICCVPAPQEDLFVKLMSLETPYKLKPIAQTQIKVAPGEGQREVELKPDQEQALKLGITVKQASFALPGKVKSSSVSSSFAKPRSIELDQELSRCKAKLLSAESCVSELEGIVQKLQRQEKESAKRVTELDGQVDERAAAIRKLGQVVAELRKEKANLLEEKKSLEHRLQLREREIDAEVHALQDHQTAPNPAGIEGPAEVAELQQQLRVLSRRYHAERVNNAAVLKRLEAVSQASRKLQIDRDYLSNLEKAHRDQARYIQYLQAEAPKVKVYKKTIKRQEENIRKLQELLEAQVEQRKQAGRGSLRRDGSDALNTAESVQQRSQGRRKKSGKEAKGDGAAMDLLMNNEDIIKEEEERADALEEKLVANARVFAKQIAELRTKLMQYEAKFDIDQDSNCSADS